MQTLTASVREVLQDKITSKAAKVGVVGLGYVGLPLAVEFAKAGFSVIGIDVLASKAQCLPDPCSILGTPVGMRWVQQIPQKLVLDTLLREPL